MSEQLSVARAYACNKAPFFSSMIYSLIPRPRPGMGTVMTTRRLVMIYDPDWFNPLPMEEAGGALIHEGLHIMNKHFERSESFPDKALFNIAADLRINQDMREMGLVLPPGSLYPEKYGFPDNLSTEEYYALLQPPPDKEQEEHWPSMKKKPGQNKEGGQQNGQGQGQQPQDKQDQGSGHKHPHGGCGSAAGHERPEESEEEDKLRAEEPEAMKTDAEIDMVVQQTAQAIQDYAKQGRGNVPKGLVDLSKFALAPAKVRWRQVLPRMIRRATGDIEAGSHDFSRRRIAKRSFVRGAIIPGMISQEPVVLFVRDTSGSMGTPQLQDAQNETVGVMKALGLNEAWFMDADAAVSKPRRVRTSDIPKLPIIGRGGTDFGPAIEAASKLRPRPNLLLYMTDGDGGAPDYPPPGMEVVWVIVRSYYNKRPAEWGHCVFVDD